MNQQKNPEIEWKTFKKKKCLNFKFRGTLTQEDAMQAVERWKSLMESKKAKQVLIWDCLEMKGYEPLARTIWQRTLKELKDKTAKIWLISDSPVILAGAKIMSIFTSFDIKAVRSLEEVLFELEHEKV